VENHHNYHMLQSKYFQSSHDNVIVDHERIIFLERKIFLLSILEIEPKLYYLRNYIPTIHNGINYPSILNLIIDFSNMKFKHIMKERKKTKL